jgi:hypothetical protein
MSEIKTPVRQGGFDQLVLFDKDGKYLCKISDCSEETAAEITTALNSLPALVEALRAACEFWYDDMPNPSKEAIMLHDTVTVLLKGAE